MRSVRRQHHALGSCGRQAHAEARREVGAPFTHPPPHQGRGRRRRLIRMLRHAASMAAACLAVAMAASGEIPLSQRRSTYQELSAETKAMQDADTGNPGMLWVLDGETLWQAKAGKAGVACAGCHGGDAAQRMKGVAARYPAFDAKRGTAVDIEDRINICRAEHQRAPELARESKDLLALTALIARQSRGLPIVSEDERLKPVIDSGRAIFTARQG